MTANYSKSYIPYLNKLVDQCNKTYHYFIGKYKMENNEFKKFRIKNRTCYYFDGIIKLEDFDLDNILIDKKSH